MKLRVFTKRSLIALFYGLSIIFLIGILTTTFFYLINKQVLLNLETFSEQAVNLAYQQQPIYTYYRILRTLTFSSTIIGGVIVGWLVKDRGWLYGGVLGVVLIVINLLFLVVVFLMPTSLTYGSDYPPNFGKENEIRNILNAIINSPITIAKTTIGGYLGEHISKRRHRTS